MLWLRYYRHYIPLLYNLRHIGLGPDYTRYEVVVGDPAYAILTDPVVSLAMAIDLCWGMGYTVLADSSVAQFHDFWLYVRGCIYISRSVWLSYLGMQILSAIVKWRRWETSYAQVDPAFLAISAYMNSGPILSLMCSTPIVWLFYYMGNFFQSAKSDDEGIECISGNHSGIVYLSNDYVTVFTSSHGLATSKK
ncbi:hypothetical protein Ae201684_011745 [Aphanomyces euteiches]|uniref:Uncharacterized protein n=1 Tax=Aphanomyces euteiches TaxID=100861 RepID=A0A6G0WTT6_9STRA|nr:hypothetical protein Ae201684_011745 [Aphanomyces euteiches]